MWPQSIMEYNGSGLIAMTGKDCVAICSDTRYGVQQVTVGCDLQRVFQVHDKLFMGLPGLVTDVQTFAAKVRFRVKMYELREERSIKPSVFANMVSNMLYGTWWGVARDWGGGACGFAVRRTCGGWVSAKWVVLIGACVFFFFLICLL